MECFDMGSLNMLAAVHYAVTFKLSRNEAKLNTALQRAPIGVAPHQRGGRGPFAREHSSNPNRLLLMQISSLV